MESSLLGESLSMAVLVMMETLSPLERAVFVLHEVFGFSFPEVGKAVDRTETAVRQLGSQARRHVRLRNRRFGPDRRQAREITERFLAACLDGDVEALMAVLTPDVTMWADGNGHAEPPRVPLHGAAAIAEYFASTAGHYPAGLVVRMHEHRPSHTGRRVRRGHRGRRRGRRTPPHHGRRRRAQPGASVVQGRWPHPEGRAGKRLPELREPTRSRSFLPSAILTGTPRRLLRCHRRPPVGEQLLKGERDGVVGGRDVDDDHARLGDGSMWGIAHGLPDRFRHRGVYTRPSAGVFRSRLESSRSAARPTGMIPG